jgi:2-polyprenyl-3-methyl-5-hydroxy-6-metoxy-1,4-benzoquinol methylase
MYNRIQKCLPSPISGRILGISGIQNFYPLMDRQMAELTEVTYPEVDMQALPYDDGTFDFVISDQVIEHLEDPRVAVHESWRVLRSGGIAVHTTCFMNYIHPCPKDLWRFSPEALRYLCADFFEVIQCEGFGNRLLHILCFMSDRLRSMQIPDRRTSLRRFVATWNEDRYPIVTWVVARK